MRTGRLAFWGALAIFPVLFLCAGIGFWYVRIFFYETADPALGSEGAFFILSWIWCLQTAFVLAGYISALFAFWTEVKNLSPNLLLIINLSILCLTLLTTFGLWMVVKEWVFVCLPFATAMWTVLLFGLAKIWRVERTRETAGTAYRLGEWG